MVVKASINFLNKSSAQEVANRTDVILDAMPKAVDVYKDPSPALALVKTSNDGLKTAIQTYVTAGGGKQLSQAVRGRRSEVVALLRLEANYVTAAADGDMEALLKSGFPVQKPNRTPIGDLAAPDAPTATQGIPSGQLKAATKPVYGGQSYNWRLALASAPDAYVQTAQTTAASTAFDGLTPGEIYNVDCNAVGSAGHSDWSDPGTMMVI